MPIDQKNSVNKTETAIKDMLGRISIATFLSDCFIRFIFGFANRVNAPLYLALSPEMLFLQVNILFLLIFSKNSSVLSTSVVYFNFPIPFLCNRSKA